MSKTTPPKVYFACAIRAGREKATAYAALVESIKKRATVLTENFASPELTAAGTKQLASGEIHAQDLAWVKEADAVIAEVSVPSLGVGYELAKAEDWGKPVLALYDTNTSGKLSAMIDGSKQITVRRYANLAEAEQYINAFLAQFEHGDLEEQEQQSIDADREYRAELGLPQL